MYYECIMIKIENYLRNVTVLLFCVCAFLACTEDKFDDEGNTSTVIPPTVDKPMANFSFSGSNKYPPCVVTFNNLSQNASSYYWDFGDGTSSTRVNPTHEYKEGGKYSVSLKAVENGESDLITKTVNVKNKPNAMYVTKVILKNFPQYDGNTNWDLMSAPDIFFEIKNASGSVLVRSGIYNECTYSDLPVTYTNNLPVKLTNLGSRYQIDFYDYDDVGNDWMAGYYFTPNDYDYNKNIIHFYSTSSDLEFDMYIQWE